MRGAQRGRRKESGGEASTTCAEREKDRDKQRGPATVTAVPKQRGFVPGGTIFVIIVTEDVHYSEGKKLGL